MYNFLMKHFSQCGFATLKGYCTNIMKFTLTRSTSQPAKTVLMSLWRNLLKSEKITLVKSGYLSLNLRLCITALQIHRGHVVDTRSQDIAAPVAFFEHSCFNL